ncbi:MOP flippase family protein [Psychroflexus halocasei]|uniref:Polysaccharide transporter, PST family/teichuronic acid exporter n=1 Tax=Psychroflexus halocasei TaxID=908615 RepID=A0A1H4D9M6_9FLAO|nr:MOP flippase family protein [Psychroflexus halocasei]SEA69216.1 polysaccharide transporter, PST family/teichuronic acid exporter [Psychroflexus halocasei]
MSLKKEVFAGLKWSTLSTIILALVALLKISILTRYLDKADFGLMAMVTFVMGFMNLFNDMGLVSAILHKRGVTKEEYGSLYWLNLFVSFAMFGVLWLVTPFISYFYGEDQLNILIPLLGINLIISGIGQMFRTIEQKNLRFKNISLIEISAAVVSLALAIYLAVDGYGVYSLIYSSLLKFALTNIFYLFLGLKHYGLLLHYKFSETRPFLKIGMYQVGGQIVNYFNRDLDILIIGKLFSPELLGGYSLAKQLVMRPAQILNPIITRVASPTLAKFQDNKEVLKRNYLKLVNIISTINLPAYLGLFIFAPWIVQILYGEGFEDIVSLVRVLSVYMAIRAIANPMGSLVIATGRTDIEFYLNLFVLLVTPICVVIGAQFGIMGAAVGITFSILLMFFPGWKLLIYKMTGATFKEYCKAIFVLKLELLKGKF